VSETLSNKSSDNDNDSEPGGVVIDNYFGQYAEDEALRRVEGWRDMPTRDKYQLLLNWHGIKAAEENKEATKKQARQARYDDFYDARSHQAIDWDTLVDATRKRDRGA